MNSQASSAAAAAGSARHLAVVLHDVSPARWEACTRVLRRMNAVAREARVDLPITLLVVPQMHGRAQASDLYLRWLHRLARAGHELALHGFTHLDSGGPPRNWRERLLRQHYTAGEGEFAALDQEQASERLAAGLQWARRHGLKMPGFVAPAWLLSTEAWRAVEAAGFDHTCTLNTVVALPGHETMVARSLVFSTRSLWRRWLSVPWNTLLAWRQRDAPLLRLELHPGDSDHPAVERCWSRLLAQALRDRQPLRLHEAAALARLSAPQGTVRAPAEAVR